MRFIVASHNEKKVGEIRAILADLNIEVVSLKDLDYHEDIVEDADSFEANALLKVRAIRSMYPSDYVMADDSGLCVEALDGKPGIYSARYAGSDSSYTEKFKQLESDMAASGSDNKAAYFYCAIAVARPDGSEFTVNGRFDGEINFDAKGEHGFGYDPIFYLPAYGRSSAEISPELKNQLSHRGKALRAMVEVLKGEI